MPSYLVVKSGLNPVGTWILLRESEFLIGSAPVCHLCVPQPRIDNVHCRLLVEGDCVRLLDHASTTGTFANGGRIASEFRLSSTDVVKVGEVRLQFRQSTTPVGKAHTDFSPAQGGWALAQSVPPGSMQIAGDADEREGTTLNLYVRMRDGDEEACGQLYYRFLPRIRRIAERSLGPHLRQMVDAEGFAHDVVVSVLLDVRAYDFRKKGAFMDFLSSKVKHAAADQGRHWSAQKRDARLTVRLLDQGFAQDPKDERPLTPDAIASLKEQMDRLRVAIDALPEDDRKALVAAKIEERKYEEIGREIGAAADAVRMRVKRAMEKLQRLFDDPNAAT
jgi:RNA polymerase sigma factor (sigma-70 family)